ncbi:Tetratricopeptide repeat-containing protein [Asanoa hainanensis]|uniref:Tetratricopeptide repeat-containing protein n=1 Tax=Asanoa hainanensis TaxID=560556 RepID=A0A239H5C6_9ACTN|nr:tetratricopeptide repeat protein [Asanoa hainanensis]SNS76218.1 Tetratricopeptide repeat-containing protein [Asanoa hainanensis]
MNPNWARHGLPAGVSTVLAVVVGALTNLATSKPSWGLVAGVVVAAGCWAVWEVRLRQRDQRAAVVEARARALAPIDRVEAADGDVFGLLVAARRALPLQGRRGELDELVAWCAGDAAVSVLVVCGPAGVGKTRLGLELADELGELAEPWVTGSLVPGQAERALPAIVACGDPVLVLVDDADTRTDLPAFLSTLAGHRGTPPVRVLLIARDGAGLLAGLRPLVTDTSRSLTRGQLLELGPHGGRGDRERWYVQAVGRFARDLKVLAPPATVLAGRVGADHETMLMILARALLTALAAERHGSVRRSPIDAVIGDLFTHEEAWWEAAASPSTWGVSALSSQTRERCILALALRGAADEDAAVRVLRRVPDLSDAAEERLRNVARWVTHLYSTGVRIQPDLFGDWFIADRLARQPALAERLLADLDPDERQWATTVLTRAASVFPAALPALAQVWRDGDAEVVFLAIRLVAVQHTAALDHHLASFIADLELAEAHLVALDQQVVDYQLPRTAIAVSRRLVSLRRAQAAEDPEYQPDLAAALNVLGLRLGGLGEHREAHLASEEAVTLWRSLAADNPAHEPQLARALINLGARRWALGDYRPALDIAEEAVTRWRTLAADDPAHQPNLASAVSDLSTHYGALGEHRQALQVAHEAVVLWRTLAADDPSLQPRLAAALNRLGFCLRESGEYRRGHLVIEETVALYRALAADEPSHQSDLASALTNLGAAHRELGDDRQAHTATEEAVTLYRALVADNPAHRPDLARALSNLGALLRELGEYRPGYTATDEALGLYRALAADNPAHQPNLGWALTNLGVLLREFGEHRQAHDVTEEAVTLYRVLVADNPAHQSDLARALSNLGVLLRELGEDRQAHAATDEAVTIYRALAADNPAHHPRLAGTLGNLATQLCALNDHDAEFAARHEAVGLYRALAAADAEPYERDYRLAVAQLQAAYSRHGRDEDAIRVELRLLANENDRKNRT